MSGPLENTQLYYPDEQQQAETGFTQSIVEEVLKHISLGTTLSDAANIVRLPPNRIISWYNKNYCNFQFSVDYHKADNKRRYLKAMLDADDATKVRAAQFMLERKYREEYGKEVTVKVNHTVIDNITKIVFDKAVRYIQDPEKLKLFIEEIAQEVRLIRGTEGLPEGQKLIT